MTFFLSVLTESWTSRFRSAIEANRTNRALERVASRNSSVLQDSPLSPPASLPALESLSHTLEAVRSFDAHAKYFINGRQGEIPEELRALLSTAADFDTAFKEVSDGGELTEAQGDEDRRARAHVSRSCRSFRNVKLTKSLSSLVFVPHLLRTIAGGYS